MKLLLIVASFVLNSLVVCSQTVAFRAVPGADQTAELQKAYSNPDIFTVVISSRSVILNGTLNIPEGKYLKFEPGCKLSGKGVINGGIVDAGYQSQIFDTSITINPAGVNQYFSAKWYGATGKGTDDYAAIQRSINTCIRNNIRTLFIPAGRYKISQPLILRAYEDQSTAGTLNAKGGFCTLEILGESSFWDANMGSEIYADFKNTFAIGIQLGKGCKIRKLKIQGGFTPPNTNDSHKFFNTAFEDFKDPSCRDTRNSPYSGIVIDPFSNLTADPLPADGGYPGLAGYYGKANSLSTQSGSTGIEIEEVSINNFVVGICSSPNSYTRNAEITLINKIQFENCKLCISGGQDQEKGNVISNIYCWGGTHTIFATGLYGSVRQAGNWNIDHANIAGAVVRFIYNVQSGYFPTYVSHVFAENLGTWGTINSELACEISDCHIDFAYPNVAGNQTLITSYGENIVYRSCNFRYYGEKTPLKIEGNCVFEHCFFSGPITKQDRSFLNKLILYSHHIDQKILLQLTISISLIVVSLIAFNGFKKRKRYVKVMA